MHRRIFLQLASWAAASPLAAEIPDQLDGPVNVHEFEALAKRKLHPAAYDFIAGGSEDEKALRANLAAFERVYLVPRVMRDVSQVDPSVRFLGFELDSPVLIAPTGGKNLVLPNGEEAMARAARKTNTIVISSGGPEILIANGENVIWWTNTLGHPTKQQAQTYARQVVDRGAKAITITADNPYLSNRDRNNRNRLDYGYLGTGIPKPGEPPPPPRLPAKPAMWRPHTPQMTWAEVEWIKSAVNVPVLVKSILAPEDAELAVQHGADGIIVSNHGGRQLDGALASLDALPDVVEAVGSKTTVLMDGGIRRGSDILKALALGAKAVLVGRAPLWGLGAFGQAGAERVLEMLKAEFKLSLALAGCASVADVTPRLVRRQFRYA